MLQQWQVQPKRSTVVVHPVVIFDNLVVERYRQIVCSSNVLTKCYTLLSILVALEHSLHHDHSPEWNLPNVRQMLICPISRKNKRGSNDIRVHDVSYMEYPIIATNVVSGRDG